MFGCVDSGAESAGNFSRGRIYPDTGTETPTLFVLLPSTRLETLVTAELLLAQDETFMKAAALFWNAPPTNRVCADRKLIDDCV